MWICSILFSDRHLAKWQDIWNDSTIFPKPSLVAAIFHLSFGCYCCLIITLCKLVRFSHCPYHSCCRCFLVYFRYVEMLPVRCRLSSFEDKSIALVPLSAHINRVRWGVVYVQWAPLRWPIYWLYQWFTLRCPRRREWNRNYLQLWEKQELCSVEENSYSVYLKIWRKCMLTKHLNLCN